MSGKRYADEFKIEAAKRVTERGYTAADVATRLGISQHSLYQWIKQFGVPESERAEARSQQEEIRGWTVSDSDFFGTTLAISSVATSRVSLI
jgi:transposase-like protein